jgi:hypothetical protein
VREKIWPVLISALAILLAPLFLQVPEFPHVPNQGSGVSHAGSAPHGSALAQLGPESSLLQFFTTTITGKSYRRA